MDNALLCELAAHPDFVKLMADLEIYVNGTAGEQVQSANAIVDTMSATIMKQRNPGLIDPQLRLNYGKLSDKEKKWLKKIAEKSDLLKNPNPQRGQKRK